MGLFGIGDGNMDLQLESQNVQSGATLRGRATLTLNKDVKGKQVVAMLYADREETYYQNGRPMSRRVNVYMQPLNLDGEKLYTKANGPYSYDLSFVIPQVGASMSGSPAGGGGGMLGGINMGVGNFNMNSMGPVRWYIKVELIHDSMLSFPIARALEIYIMPQASQQQQTMQ